MAFFLDESTLFRLCLSDWDFIDDDGSILHRATDGTAAFDAILFYYSNFACDDPRNNLVLRDLTRS